MRLFLQINFQSYTLGGASLSPKSDYFWGVTSKTEARSYEKLNNRGSLRSHNKTQSPSILGSKKLSRHLAIIFYTTKTYIQHDLLNRIESFVEFGNVENEWKITTQ